MITNSLNFFHVNFSHCAVRSRYLEAYFFARIRSIWEDFRCKVFTILSLFEKRNNSLKIFFSLPFCDFKVKERRKFDFLFFLPMVVKTLNSNKKLGTLFCCMH